MPRLIAIAVVALALVGCDPAVQARYQPTSVDDIFNPITRVAGVAADMHELPNTPPAMDESEVRPRSCRPPGVGMPPTSMVGIRDDSERVQRLDPTPMVAMYEPPLPSPPPGSPYPIASWNQHVEKGAKEPIATPVEWTDLTPGRSIYRNEPTPAGSYRRDIYSWCDDAANRR